MLKKAIVFTILILVIVSYGVSEEYTASPGDRLFIYVLKYAGFNQEVMVRSDGKISYIGGDLKVEGLNTEEIANKIKERLKGHILKPIVFVSPMAKGNEIFVLGAVNNPNVYRFGFTDELELRQVIAMAGGISQAGADLTRVTVIKKEQEIKHYDITKFDSFEPIWVYPGDTVIVKPWEFDADKRGDVVFKYTPAAIQWLKRKGFLKEIEGEF